MRINICLKKNLKFLWWKISQNKYLLVLEKNKISQSISRNMIRSKNANSEVDEEAVMQSFLFKVNVLLFAGTICAIKFGKLYFKQPELQNTLY